MRPQEVTDFLRCGGMNCDGSCERYPNTIGDCMTGRVHDYVIQLEQRVPRWISVEERLPEYPCIVYDGINAPYVPQSIVRFPDTAGGTKCYPDVGIEAVLRKELPRYHRPAVTHWMPLPKRPKKEDDHATD